jgi:hypothetical protein
VLSADASTVALSKIALKYLGAQGVQPRKVFAVLNRATGLEGLSRTEIEQELGISIAGLVPHMREDLTLAYNQHVPIMAKFPKQAGAYALSRLASDLLKRMDEIIPA